VQCEEDKFEEMDLITNAETLYKITSLEELPMLQPIIPKVKKVKPINLGYRKKYSTTFINLNKLNTDKIIQYRNETGASTYTLKLESEETGIAFENLHIIEVEEGYIAYILRYEPSDNWYKENLRLDGTLSFSKSKFRGNISKYTLERELIWTTKSENTSYAVKEGAIISYGSGGSFVEICVISAAPPCLEGNHSNRQGWDGCQYSDGKSVTTCWTSWVSGGSGGDDVYNNDPDGSTGGGTTDPYGCETVSGTRITDTQPISGMESGCTTNSVVGVISDTDKGDQIFNNLEGKDLCVFNEVISTFLGQATIQKFKNNTDYNLKIQYGNCENGGDGCTDGKDILNGNITIIINTTVGTYPLEFASVLLHEGVHAELYKYVDEHIKGIDPNNRQNLMYYYFKFKNEEYPYNSYQTSIAQHQHMADTYIVPIAEAIRELDAKKYPLNYYMAFGWEGLQYYGYDQYLNSDGQLVYFNKLEFLKLMELKGIVNKNSSFNPNCN